MFVQDYHGSRLPECQISEELGGRKRLGEFVLEDSDLNIWRVRWGYGID
jgi:hypothetical protein